MTKCFIHNTKCAFNTNKWRIKHIQMVIYVYMCKSIYYPLSLQSLFLSLCVCVSKKRPLINLIQSRSRVEIFESSETKRMAGLMNGEALLLDCSILDSPRLAKSFMTCKLRHSGLIFSRNIRGHVIKQMPTVYYN